MPNLYLSNDSYPELRDVQPRLARTAVWWRAIGRAARHVDFWRFVLLQAALFAGWLLLQLALVAALRLEGAAATSVRAGAAVAALLGFGYLQVSVGGDMMRSHLRAVSETARHACPRCGHSLRGHLEPAASDVRCPECGETVGRALFAPPYRVPPRYRAFPPGSAPR